MVRGAGALTSQDLLVSAATVERYASARRPWLRGDHVHRLLGAVAGKHILEVGCGDGSNAVLLAMRGATVTGIATSEALVDLARARAAANAVSDRTRFVVVPDLTIVGALPAGPFDVVLDSMALRAVPEASRIAVVLGWLDRLVPSGLLVMVEGLERQWLRRRAHRDLGVGEVAAIEHLLVRPARQYFGFFTMVLLRLQFAPNYEASAPWQRVTYDVAGLLDRALLRLPLAYRLAQSVVIAGRQGAGASG